ncbi:MAG: helicase-associated domain-containing protein, partial [Treponema sp.]|nr:helicase-associated domain-containing protein [Treponema sp.]
MRQIFRSVEFWKSALMTMPDNSFFELLRCVFGKIKTPFNKQQLLKDLEMFLLRKDIQKTIASYIDENDAKIISAVALFGESAPGELESFFSDEFSFAQLQDIIVNLEERFIFYRIREEIKPSAERQNRLAVNPVLKKILQPIADNTSLLFPAAKKQPDIYEAVVKPQKTTVLNDCILAGFLSFVSQWESFYKAETIIRKQVIEKWKSCFPGADISHALGSLQILGLFYIDGSRLVPDKKHIDDFGLLSPRERMEYCAAALLIYKEINCETNILPPLFKSRIRETTNFIHGFLDSLEAGFHYSEQHLRRLTEILKARTGVVINSMLLFDALEKTGLITAVRPPKPAGKKETAVKQLGSIFQNTEKSKGPFLAIDSGFSVLVYPEIDFPDAVKLAAFLKIRETGAGIHFELEKDSAVRAFDNGICADEIIDLLNRLSGGRVEDAIVWNLKEWERRHSEVLLCKGVVLTLSEDRKFAAETMPLAGMILKTLAPGVYLLNENAAEEAAAALQNAGVDIIARTMPSKAAFSSSHSYFSAPAGDHFIRQELKQAENFYTIPEKQKLELTENFHAMLEKMQMDKTARAELSARIDRRLILCEAQLKDPDVRFEKLEAKLMD